MRSCPVALLAMTCVLATRPAAADPVMETNGACRARVPAASDLFVASNGTATASEPHARAWPVLQFGEAPPCPVPRLDGSAVTFATSAGDQSAPPPVAFQYSNGYAVRDKIHKAASFAMLPLFGVEAYLGQKLLTNPNTSPHAKSAHQEIAVAIFGLFGVNTVTGVWNLVEGGKDPHRGVRPVIHGVLMLAADVGFVATTLTGPKSRTAAQQAAFPDKANLHKTLAYASVSVATVGYLIMLFR